MAVLDCGSVVPAFDPNEAGFLDRLGIVAGAYAAVAKDIARETFVELRRALAHCLLRVKNKGQVLIFDFYLAQGLHGAELIPRDYNSNVVSPETDVVREQQPVRHVLVLGFRGPGMAGGREIVFGDVKAGENSLNALHGASSFHVYALHQRVRVFGMEYLCRQHIPVAEVGGIFCTAHHLIPGIHTRHGLSYITQAAAPFLLSSIYNTL